MQPRNPNFSEVPDQSNTPEEKPSSNDITLFIEQTKKDMSFIEDVINSFATMSSQIPTGFFSSARWNNLVGDFRSQLDKYKQNHIEKYKQIDSGHFTKFDLENAKRDLNTLLITANSIISFDFKAYQLNMKSIIDVYVNKLKGYNETLVSENTKLKSAEKLYTIQKQQAEKLKEKNAKQMEATDQLKQDKEKLEATKDNLLTATGVLAGSLKDLPLSVELIFSRLGEAKRSDEEVNLAYQQINGVIAVKQRETQELLDQVLPSSFPRLFGAPKNPVAKNPGFTPDTKKDKEPTSVGLKKGS